jgi:hypothetical protein
MTFEQSSTENPLGFMAGPAGRPTGVLAHAAAVVRVVQVVASAVFSALFVPMAWYLASGSAEPRPPLSPPGGTPCA